VEGVSTISTPNLSILKTAASSSIVARSQSKHQLKLYGNEILSDASQSCHQVWRAAWVGQKTPKRNIYEFFFMSDLYIIKVIIGL